MPRTLAILCIFVLLCALGGGATRASGQGAAGIFGFGARAAAAERALERRFLTLPSATKARETHAFLTADPHVAGSPRDRVLAEWIRDRWRDYGLERVEIVEHDVLLPYPIEAQVEMLTPTPWRATMKEDAVEGDPFSARDTGIAYHAYSASGDVTAAVVFAGSGSPEDYDRLTAKGVTVAGKIVLVRYSVPYSYRGFKALTAEQHGAAGILIYSDPLDDGAKKGPTYPKGPWGPDSHIQRGGIAYDFRVPGDPLTPGWASEPGARRIAPADAVSLPKIISAPLSWRDARPILDAVRSGAETRVHLRVRNDEAVRPIWTVTGRISGTDAPADLVIAGNHRDAWVYGGVDPSSGTASLMELARSIGTLARQGARPKRTIVFASWDAEEFSLTSSTEWGEQHAAELGQHAVAYLNVDSSGGGPNFNASAVPSLNRVIAQSVRDVLGQHEDEASIRNRLGSGSDYTVFLNRLGVPIADLTYDGPYGVYHSVYDNHLWVEKFGDPAFLHQTAMARVWGVIALRLANAEVVPLDYRTTAQRLREFVNESVEGAGGSREALSPLNAAVGRFAGAADAMANRINAVVVTEAPARGAAARLSEALIRTERAFLDPAGLAGRPWYRHLVFAPKPTYEPEILPGVTEALASRDRTRIAAEVKRLTAAIDRATAELESY